MYTAAQLRLLARSYKERAQAAPNPAAQAMLRVMSTEFERDAAIADREERREAYRRLAEQAPPRPALTGLAA